MIKTIVCLFLTVLLAGVATYGQDNGWENSGSLESVEVEIIKEREIVLPEAARNFDKIPPATVETVTPSVEYNFQPFNFSAPLIKPSVRPLKLKQEGDERIYGGMVQLGYGNYASPLLDAYFNSRKDKNKLVGAKLSHFSSGKGPVDGKNSGSGTTSLSVFTKSFNEEVALSGDVEVENRTTHFYGYDENLEVDRGDIKQSYAFLKLNGGLSSTRKTDASYQLNGFFSYMADKYDARETEFGLNVNSRYAMQEENFITLKAGLDIMTRKDDLVEGKARTLFTVAPSYTFYPIENLKLTFGVNAAFENDTLDKKDIHLYPDAHVSYPVSPSVDFFASLTGGIDKVTLQTLSRENIWIGPNIPLSHTNRSIDLSAGIRARLGSKIGVHTGIGMVSLKNWYFFVNDDTDQSKFRVIYDEGSVERNNVFAALSYTQSEMTTFSLRGDFFTYSTDEVDEPWHRPTYRLTANGKVNVYNKIILTAGLITQGGMKALEPLTEDFVKLDNAIDLQAKAEYLFSPGLSFFVQLNNIVGNNYPLFLYYPVRGFQGVGGITWSF